MTIYNSSKRALFFSVIALFICIIMLLGATYAWFTDSETSPDNQIQTGNLDVQLYQWTADDANDNISDKNTVLFPASIIWEPGMTQVVYLSVKNAGDLALKYKLDIVVTDITTGTNYNLADVMEYSIVKGTSADPFGYVTKWESGNKFVNAPGSNATSVADVELVKGAEDFYAIAIHMLETAGNEYMNKSITFDIDVLAGQATEEKDSFNSDKYDEFAGYAGIGKAPKPAAGVSATEIPVTDKAGNKVGSVVIPTEAVADDATELSAIIDDSTYKANITVAAGNTAKAYEVKVMGLKEGNTTPVKAELRINAGLDPNTVKLYHYDDEIDCNYNPTNGYVSFETTTFSPFTVVYNADSVYDPKPEAPEKIPVAKVTYASDWVETTPEWGSYDNWAPTEGKEATIDAAFIFECPDPETVDEAYDTWLCDFYVSLDRDLGKNQIFLGGQYGSYLVGFHNGDLELPAKEELPLLGTALSGGRSNWTYADVRSFVETFKCGVGDVEGCLEGATFTVKLRLTNPTNDAEFYDVNVVSYTFGGEYVIK